MDNTESFVFRGYIKKVASVTGSKESTVQFVISEESRKAASEMMEKFLMCPLEVAGVKIKDEFGSKAEDNGHTGGL